MQLREVILVGAGPLGIELAVALRRAGLDCLHFEAGQIGQTVSWWPPATRWFSSPGRIEIAGVPIQTVAQEKCTREEYLAYLRAVVLQHDLEIHTYRRVTAIERDGGGGFGLETVDHLGRAARHAARRVVLATGGTAQPAPLDVPGAGLPHVMRFLGDPHRYFRQRVLVVGGRNSAVEAALRLHRCAARVAISYRGPAFPDRVKYWLRPEIEHLISTGAIAGHFRTLPAAIEPLHVTLRRLDGGSSFDVPADFVLAMIGYEADMSLFEMAGVTLEGAQRVPRFDPRTMETDVAGLYVAGTATAGTQRSGVRVFLENCHVHVGRIVAALTGAPPPPEPPPVTLPEA